MALGVPVLVLTTFDEDAHLLGTLAAGASGYLLKDIESQALIGSIRVTASGGRVVAPNPTQRLIDRAVTSYAEPEPAPPPRTWVWRSGRSPWRCAPSRSVWSSPRGQAETTRHEPRPSTTYLCL